MKDEINYSEMLFNRDERLLDYITNLQKENKHLNLQLDQALKDYDEELTKRYKAIEYIKEQEDYFNNYPLIDRNYLLEILGDKE